MTHARTPGKAYDSSGNHTGPGQWLTLVREVNRIAPDTFGVPVLGPWWDGGEAEEYPDARVIHRPDGSVSVISKTGRGAEVLAQAAANLGITVQPGEGELS